MRFTKHRNTSLFLLAAPEQSSDDPNELESGFIAYYDDPEKIDGPEETDDPDALTLEDDPDELTLEQTWESCLGYYLFLKREPDDLDAFAAEASLYLGAQSPAHTGFLWLAYDGSSLSTIASIETIMDETDPDNPRVVVVHEVLLDFGGYKLPFGKDTPVVYENPEGPTGFVYLVPSNPLNRYPPSDTPIPAPSDGVHLTFTGERRGCFECLSFIGDYYSHKSTSWHVGLRYAVNVNEKVVHQFYPVFDLRDGRRPLLKMCWDLTDPLNPDRTYLEFQAKSVKLVSAGEGECNYRRTTPNHPEIIPTYFRAVTGEVIGVIPLREGTSPARLVFELWTQHPDPRVLDDLESAGDWGGEMDPPANSRYYLVPSGQFELVLIHVDENDGYAFDPITSVEEEADKKAEIPSQFLCGLSGIESVEFMPRDKDDMRIEVSGNSIVFFPRKPAYVPAFPLMRAPESAVPALNDLELIQRKYLTAWIGFAGADEGFAYFSQPEEAPLYTAEDNNPKDELITLYEPVAAKLPLASLQHSFPVAPAAGVTPVSGAPEPGPAVFIQNLETPIIGPWRREVIRKFSDAPADVPPEKVITVTPQGLKATVGARVTVNGRKAVKAQKWTGLLLARKAEVDKEPGFELSFSSLESTLQAAFQSSQLFLVVSNDTHFNLPKGFKSVVKMGGWEFDLSPAKSDPANLNNILIFKFSPGKLKERIRDPRSWTNPEAFNKAKPSQLASKLTKFFDLKDKLGDPATARYYEPLQAIIEDELWTGIIGINVAIPSRTLPAGLALLAAGVDKDQLVAHHIVVETSTLEFISGTSLEPAECSLFGLIDVEPKRTELNDQRPIDFAVTRLLAHFLKGELADFSCNAELTLVKLFGEKIVPSAETVVGIVGSGGGLGVVPVLPFAAPGKINLIGTRERHGDRDTYSLVIDPADLKKPVTLDSSVIKFVAIDKAQFNVDETDELFSVIFSFWGGIGFHTLKDTSGVPFDLFSYDRLPFTGLLVRMDVPKFLAQVETVVGSTVTLSNAEGFKVSHPVNKVGAGENEAGAKITSISGNTFTLNGTITTLARGDRIEVTGLRKSTIDLGGLALDGTSTGRTNSLVRRFPMKLQKFYNSASGADPRKDGYVPVNSALGKSDLGKPIYGLDFTLNLGTLGEFASNAGITVGLLLAWSPWLRPKDAPNAMPENKVGVFLKFPGVSAAATDLASLQGVVKLGARSYELKAPDKDRTSWALMLNEIALRILGIGFPRGDKPNLYIFGPPPDQPQEQETSLGWYAVYRKDDKPSGPAARSTESPAPIPRDEI